MTMKKYLYLLLFPVLLTTSGCEEEEEPNNDNPDIQFKKTEGYTYSNTSVNEGDSIKVGILAESNGTDNITAFVILRDQQTIENISMDRASLDADIIIKKNALSSETWKFIVWDKSNRGDSIWLTLTKEGSKGLLPFPEY